MGKTIKFLIACLAVLGLTGASPAWASVITEKKSAKIKVRPTGTIKADSRQSPMVIKKAQAVLTRSGYRVKADGLWGPKTAKAVRQFQKSKKLKPTGRLDRLTLAVMGLR